MYLFLKVCLLFFIIHVNLLNINCWDDFDSDFDVCEIKECDENNNVIEIDHGSGHGHGIDHNHVVHNHKRGPHHKYKVHKKICSHETEFSAQELEAVRKYLQRRFKKTNPSQPACKKLHVRKEIRCLNPKEIHELISVFKALYANGVFDWLSLIHGSYWPSIHKFVEVVPWHRYHVNKFEQEMRKINPNITLPYWEYLTDFAAPEKSKIWDIFGHSGHRYNGYCVPDSPFAYQRVRFPEVGCLKRQWNVNGTMPVWEPPEWATSITQVSNNFPDYANLFGNSAHFKTHLSVGGYVGDMSDIFATNDPIFYPYHAHVADYVVLKWQLSNDLNLVPSSYSNGQKYDWKRDMVVGADIDNDVLTHYENIRVRDMFQVGFGELCYIHDQLVRPILDIISNKAPKIPKSVLSLQKSLPKDVLQQYFPKFASKTATPFDYILPDVDTKFNKKTCKEMPVALPYKATPNGRRLLYVMATEANIDITPNVLFAEQQYFQFMDIIKRYRYCSPYV